MKATPLAAFAAPIVSALLAIFCAQAPSPARAQAAGDVFAVTGVQVDEQAANAAAAQQAGFRAAQRRAFDRLARRLSSPADQARLSAFTMDDAALERLVLSVDIEEERRSGTRYIGRLGVRFDPDGVRTLLRSQAITLVEARAAPVLAAPIAPPDATPEVAAAWRDAWAHGGFQNELAPILVAPAALTGAPDWPTAQPYARAAAAASALYATLRIQGGTVTAALVEVGPQGRRDRGEATARINGEGPAGLRAALSSLAEQANQRLQTEWKANTGAVPIGARARVSASALYDDQRQWERIKTGLEAAASTLISEIRIEAVGREGALVSFSFIGDRAQLTAELARRGISLEDGAMGPVLRLRR